MCGFLGIAKAGNVPLPGDLRLSLRQAARLLEARGPDGEGNWVSSWAEVRFRRLAINDLEGGQQPFVSEDQTVSVFVNGEIFNHRQLRRQLGPQLFRSGSDCEVVLHLYRQSGLRGLEKLEGMFAVVIIDEARRQIHFLRDRLGIKPLFFHHHDQTLSFGSEVRPLSKLAGVRTGIDWQTALTDPWFAQYPALSYQSLNSWFSHVTQLPPGSRATFDVDRGTFQCEQWWNPFAEPTSGDSAASGNGLVPVEVYREFLVNSVEACLSGEAGSALFLSGGVDSMAIAGIAVHLGADLLCVTSSSASAALSGDLAAARIGAQSLGLPLERYSPEDLWGDLTPEVWHKVLKATENPLSGPEQLYKMAIYEGLKERHSGVKITLSGQGSDEFNGGYSRLFIAEDETLWESFEESLELLRFQAEIHQTQDLSGWWNELLGENVLRHTLIPSRVEETFSHWDSYHNYVHCKWRDLLMFNLWHEDRMASAHSMENRVPFLDHRLVEFGIAVPPILRSTLLMDKKVMRAAVAPFIPESLANRPKVPFFYGKGEFEAARDMCELLLADDRALIQQAFGESLGMREWVCESALHEAFDRVSVHPEHRGWEAVLRLVNLGLLDSMTVSDEALTPNARMDSTHSAQFPNSQSH